MSFDNEQEREAIREVVQTLYRSISGPAGAPRAWGEMEALYAAPGRMTPFNVGDDGAVHYDVFTPLTYAQSRTLLFAENAFYEDEVGHAATIEGHLAHVFSHYEARRTPDGPAFTSGVNSIQLVREAEGWKVLSIAWQFTGVAPSAKR
jgi:hypothetical protein